MVLKLGFGVGFFLTLADKLFSFYLDLVYLSG